MMMRKYFYGDNRRGPYFEGWYFKCQTKDGESLALIPAVHIDDKEEISVSVQVVANGGTWWLEYPAEAFRAEKDRLHIQIDENIFSEAGMSLKLDREDISLHGHLRFGPLLPLRSDIMGPFRFFANMECAHGVISMAHSLQGELTLNGKLLDFNGGTGYIETDRGRSFPNTYLWTQCAWQDGSLMLAVAAIPLAKIHFTGCICAIVYHGQEYRLATYRGVKVESWSEHGVVIRQGKYRLEVELLEKQPQPLRAPVSGMMIRTIHESLCSKVCCRFWNGENLLFDQIDFCGSFEFANQ